VQYFLPIILQIDKLRELEAKGKGSDIKVKKYETMLVQIWQLLPKFCSSNSPNMRDCFIELLKYLEPILNNDLLSLRNTALKTFSTLIKHCRHTKVVDEQIKFTRKGLQNIAMDYIQGLVGLYIKDANDDVEDDQMETDEPKRAPKKNDGQQMLLATLQDFASIAKTGKLSNLFLESFAQTVALKESNSKAFLVKRNLDVLIAMLE